MCTGGGALGDLSVGAEPSRSPGAAGANATPRAHSSYSSHTSDTSSRSAFGATSTCAC